MFEPAVHTEETPEARILILDLPGFRREDLRVQVNSRRNLIISGERPVKEMEETTKVGGRSEKIRSGGQKFRKVIDVPENVDLDDITAKLKDQRLRVSLPLLQKNQQDDTGGAKPHVADLSDQSKPDERSSPVKQPAATQNIQSASLPEAIRQDDYKAKPTAAAEESNAEAPMHAQDFAHGKPPISTHTQAVSAQAGFDIGDHSQIIQSKCEQGKDDESCLPSPNDQFQGTLFQFASSARRLMFSNREFSRVAYLF